MEQTVAQQIQTLTARLNQYRNEYYNLSAPSVTNEVYDRLFDELKALEQTTGIVMADSPTQTVGYPAVDDLPKTQHIPPLLSLDKQKEIPEVLRFINGQIVTFMLKLDGLTIKLVYENGRFIEASTRGNGDIGSIVTHNANAISGIPMKIPFPGRLVVVGETFIRPSDFEQLKETVVLENGEHPKEERNLASGSILLHDAAVCRERRLHFMPFAVQEGMDEIDEHSERLQRLKPLGFDVFPVMTSTKELTARDVEGAINALTEYAKQADIPIDGIVVKFESIRYGKGLGRTDHHYKDGIAIKPKDDLYETKLTDIEWNPSRSGEITPVALLGTVMIGGREISRSSLHNLSFIEDLELMPGNRVYVSTRNMIIPHIEENLDRGGFDLQRLAPSACPCCGRPTRIGITVSKEDGEEKETKKLFCDNAACPARFIRQFEHFTGEKALDVAGLSEATLEKLIGHGFLRSFTDVFRLDQHKAEVIKLDGFGEKSFQNLWNAIQTSRNTTFERYLCAMDIPMIGSTASHTLAEQFHSSIDEFEAAVMSGYDFTKLPDFGETLHSNIHAWFQQEEHWYFWEELRMWVVIAPPCAPAAPVSAASPFAGKTIVVTGKIEPYTRTEMNDFIASLGAVAGSSVTGKTNYLVCGEKAGSKLDKARSLGIAILSPDEFFAMARSQGAA